jgi:hypothetical protein
VRPEELENEAAHNRHIAARARRLACSLSPGSERQGLERYAKELEHHAAELEAQARTLSPISSSAADETSIKPHSSGGWFLSR